MTAGMEIADTLSKTELVAKLRQQLKASSEMDQRQAETILQKKNTANAEQASQPEKSDLVIIKNTEEKGKEKRKFKHNEKETGRDNQDDTDDTGERRLDITV